MAEGSPSRWEDVFQDEIVRKVPHDSFKFFARSSSGLGLSSDIVDEIFRDYPTASEWKMKLLLKWKSMNPEATPDTIRSRANKFMTLGVNQEFSDTGTRQERFEDVFQDEIVKVVSHDEFKEFARSKVGLCLSEDEVDDIIHDFPKASEQRIQMLYKWKSKQPEVTTDKIRQIARKYISPDTDNEFSDPVPSIRYPCLKMEPEDQILLIIKPTEEYTLSFYSLTPHLQSEEYNKVKLDKVMGAQEFNNNRYTSVAVGDFLYILGWNGSVYKASFCSSDQTWMKLGNAMLFLHGRWPLAVAVGDKIYLCGGGWNDKGVVDVRDKAEMPDSTKTSEMLDTVTEEFSSISNMLFSRRYHAMAASEHTIYAIGGISGRLETQRVLKSVEVYDVKANIWKEVAPLNEPRSHAAAAQCNGKVYIQGGRCEDQNLLSSAECYDPATNVWTTIGDMTTPRYMYCVVVCDQKLYAVGGDPAGSGRFPPETTIECYDPAKDDGWKKYKKLTGVEIEAIATVAHRM